MNEQIRHVLAPTDLSEAGVTALRYARFFAEKMPAKLTVMYSDPVVYPVDVVGGTPSIYVESAPERIAEMEKELEVYAQRWLEGCPHEILATTGQPVPMVLRIAAERGADLIVMGTHALRGWRRTILGSVTEGVLHGSRCPVLTVSSLHRMPVMHGDIGITKIICPVNFTDVARESLEYAAKLAEILGAEVVIVHVSEPGVVSDLVADETRVREWMEPEMRAICTFRELVLRGGAAERVLDCIDDIGGDLLVIGAQHKFFRDATVIGTTTERLVRFAQCPVLTVTRDATARGRKPVHAELASA